jgi:TonB-dependent starch-binding outer membrane protein SusC
MTSLPPLHTIPMPRHPVRRTDTTTSPTAEGSTMRELRPRQAGAARRARLYRAIATRALAALALAVTTGTALAAAPAALQAQQAARISGIVTDEAGQPVPSVQLSVVGTRLGALTDQAGRFTIVGITPGTIQLRAQRIGYRPVVQDLVIAPGQAATANVRLTGAATVLNQVAVVGYTTQTRRDVSDATAGVTAEDLRDQQFATVEEGLRGRVPGVNITASGEPGRGAEIVIRGQNFFGAATPLYVVDGMYLRQNPNLNPDDIESIEILKDASAAAQYGAQAANGVVVIRTKHGRQGENNKFELRSYYGSQDVPTRIDMMNAQQWATLANEAYANAGVDVEDRPGAIAAALAGNGPNTDWQDQVFRRGAIQNHNLAFSGATQNANYLISGGFFSQDGSVIETDFKRANVRVNSELSRGRITLGENIALSRSDRQGLVADFLTDYPLVQVVRMLPTVPVRVDTSAACATTPSSCYSDPKKVAYGYGTDAGGDNPTNGTNPVGLLEARPRTERSNQVIGSAFGQVRLIGNLSYRLNLGMNYENYAQSSFSSIRQIRQGPAPENAELTEIRNNWTSLLAENLLTWDQGFRDGSHRVTAVAGATQQTIDADDITAFRRGFSDEAIRVLDAATGDQTSNGRRTESVLRSYLLRANYAGWDRYLLTASIRRDGSSRFGPNNRWGTFPAVSAGWVISEEDFYKNTPWLNRATFLKLRASTGTLGNQDIGDYRTVTSIAVNRLGYNFGAGTITGGATQLGLANKDLKWQQTQTNNIGLDLGMLEDRLTFSFDAYRTNIKDALLTPPIPWSLGTGLDVSRGPSVNFGSLKNTGTEFGLTYRYGENNPRAFHLNTTATYTSTRNVVTGMGGSSNEFTIGGVSRTAVGMPIGTFYVIKTAGIFQTQAEIDAYTRTIQRAGLSDTTVMIQPDAQPGDVKFVDFNRDGRIDADDYQNVGNGTPKYSYGLFFDGNWRALDFGLNLRGAGGYKIFNAVRYWTDRGDEPSGFRADYRPWTVENRSNTTPRISSEPTLNNNERIDSDRWVEDGGFLRIQNIVLGVRLPTALVSRLTSGRTFDSRVYVNLQNVHTFSDYTGWDPETLGNADPLARGLDTGRIFPNVRTVSIGLDLRL